MMTVKFWRDTRFGASIERSGAACQTVTEIQLDSKSEAAVLPMTLDQRDEILASKKGNPTGFINREYSLGR